MLRGWNLITLRGGFTPKIWKRVAIKNTYILFFGPVKHIQKSKQSEADTGDILLVRIKKAIHWVKKVLEHFLKSHNFFRIGPNDMSFF